MGKARTTRKNLTRIYAQQARQAGPVHTMEGQAPQLKLLLILVTIISAMVLITHWPAMSAKAMSFDDNQYLINNNLVQNPSWQSAKRFLTEILEPSTVGGYYQPLTMISIMFDYALGGRSDYIRPFHTTSLIIHIFNTTLIICLLYLLFRNVWIAAAAGLLFGLHPMTVEPIPWVGERKTLLAAFFSLLCLISYIRYTRFRSFTLYTLSFAFFILALMAKPTSTPIPALLLLLDFWPLNRFSKRAILEKIPFFIIAGLSSVITVISQGRTGGLTAPTEHTPAHIALTLCHNIIFYLYKIIWPINLSSHYAFPEPLSLAQPMVLAGVIGTPILIALLIISARRTRAILVGWLFFFVAILPTMGIIGFTVVIASDKYAYLPAVGLLLTLAWLLNLLWKDKYRIPTLAVIIVLASFEVFAARNYLAKWKTTETIYNHMLSFTPDSVALHNNLGIYLFNSGKTDQAVSHYEYALKFKPDDGQLHNNLAIALSKKGLFEQAIEHYNKALNSPLKTPDFYNNLGNVFAAQGKLDQAIEQFQNALKIKPYSKSYFNLGKAFQIKGNLEQAIDFYRQALSLKPNYVEAYVSIGDILTQQGKLDQALAEFDVALKFDPRCAHAHYNAAVSLATHNRPDEAISRFEQALQIDPNYPDADNNIGIVLAQKQRYTQAIEHFQKALKVSPDSVTACFNLANALAQDGKLDESIGHFRKIIQRDPNNADAHCRLADILNEKGLTDQAVSEYRQTLSLNPKHPQAGKALQQIMADRQNR